MAHDFDPAAWLERLQSLGGYFTMYHGGHIAVGFMVYRNPEANQIAARHMLETIADEEAAILKQHVAAQLVWEG